MSDTLNIRPATSDDLEKVLDLYRHLTGDEKCPLDLAEENFARFQKFEGSAILLGEIGGEPVTSCVLVIVPNLSRGGRPYALIENVVTHAGHRGMGYGKLILEAASNRAWDRDCYKVMLMTGSRRPSTLGFYESAGFEQSKTGFQKRRLPARPD